MGERRFTARVRVVLDLYVSDVWGEACTIDQAMSQATRSAEALVASFVEATRPNEPDDVVRPLFAVHAKNLARAVGEPSVIEVGILPERKDGR